MLDPNYFFQQYQQNQLPYTSQPSQQQQLQQQQQQQQQLQQQQQQFQQAMMLQNMYKIEDQQGSSSQQQINPFIQDPSQQLTLQQQLLLSQPSTTQQQLIIQQQEQQKPKEKQTQIKSQQSSSQSLPQQQSSQQQQQDGSNNENLQEKLIRKQRMQEETNMITQFMVDNVGILSTAQLFLKKQELQILSEKEIQIYDILLQKYLQGKKTKEEMIKYIIRKSFRFMKEKMGFKEMTSQKDIDEQFTEKYFGRAQLGIKNCLKASDLAQFSSDEIMPFKKTSKNKTMNNDFLKKIFASPLFQHDYKEYLEKFDALANQENDKKIEKCAQILVGLIEKQQFDKIKNYKRLPWTKQWINQTKSLAEKLWEYTTEQGLKIENEQNSESGEKSNSLEESANMKKRKISNMEKSEQFSQQSETNETQLPFDYKELMLKKQNLIQKEQNLNILRQVVTIQKQQ